MIHSGHIAGRRGAMARTRPIGSSVPVLRRTGVGQDYLSTRGRTKMRLNMLAVECTMIPIHELWNRREG